MTLTAPRTAQHNARPLIESHPIRYPNSGDVGSMGRRAWWLVVLNGLIPGSAQVLAGNRRLGRFGLAATLLSWVLAVIAGGLALFARPTLIWIATGPLSWFALTLAQILMLAYVVLWVILTIDTLRLLRLVKLPVITRWVAPIASILVLALVGSGVVYASGMVASGRGALETIFGNSGPSLPPSDGYYNILLLGADSGEGRDSLRFDSISVVSVNATSGAMTITGIPRELPHPPFSEGSPMHKLYPNGFQSHGDPTCGWNAWMNHVRNAAEVCREDHGAGLYPDAAAQGSAPGIEATKDAVEGVLGVEIPYYVFVDMNGFADMVDALGGVDVTVTERLPKGGPAPGQGAKDVNKWAIGWIEPGAQHMNGDTAQWYARSRYTTSDYDRMKRQRQLQEAILAQFTPENVLTNFSAVADAGADLASTDLPKDKLPEFFDLMMSAKKQPVTRLELTPENGIEEKAPDFTLIRQMVKDALHPPTNSPAPAS